MSALSAATGTDSVRFGSDYLAALFEARGMQELNPQQPEPRWRTREICARIREARLEQGFSQRDMAEYLGVTVRAYRNYESSRVPFDKLAALELILRKPERWFLYGDDPIESEEYQRLQQQLSDVKQQLETVLGLLANLPPHE